MFSSRITSAGSVLPEFVQLAISATEPTSPSSCALRHTGGMLKRKVESDCDGSVRLSLDSADNMRGDVCDLPEMFPFKRRRFEPTIVLQADNRRAGCSNGETTVVGNRHAIIRQQHDDEQISKSNAYESHSNASCASSGL
ncbi:hypothetical protein POJ06DRAFT_31462 [Lipomyces tetrasporus]|uniref:Uncharacterized protein n=1 Tax=Lipomyces tetrasporus TaxID=54092 RepID=A0AAD7QLN4_9ASCO|nr:uncharacterized protein POJ06DRAFT_31462 [Lipomyces tetrasporus]KAJ8097424.1 hypothetical protein POJ06DRAFT_31462 [Lipomyces tetrasporus]